MRVSVIVVMQSRQRLALLFTRSGKPDIIISCSFPNTLKFHNYSQTFTEPKKTTTWHHVVVQMAWPHGGGICKSTCPWLDVFISVPLIEIRWHFLKVHQGKLLRSYFPESWNILLTPKPPLCSVCQYGNLKYLIAFLSFFFRRAGQWGNISLAWSIM